MSFLTDIRVTLESVEEACVIRVAGEIDYGNADHLRRHLNDARHEGDTTLLDLERVEFMDSAGLEVLLEASDAVDSDLWPFFIVRPSAAVRRVVDATGTGDRLALVQVHEERPLS
jgi:stage II sporulation protein AA (anti-sigma F factor antagonist)